MVVVILRCEQLRASKDDAVRRAVALRGLAASPPAHLRVTANFVTVRELAGTR